MLKNHWSCPFGNLEVQPINISKGSKKQSSIETLLNNLANLNTLSSDLHTRMAVSHLADLLKAILAVGKVEADIANEIFKLRMNKGPG